MKVAVIGAGWAGCAAAVEAARLGHEVTVFEASRIPGGRARRVDARWQGKPISLDNGQHILIGAYSETLALMSDLGVDGRAALLRMPLTMRFPDGSGLALPRLPAPLDALVGIAGARGWSWHEKLSLLKLALRWRLNRFSCGANDSVTDICQGLAASIMSSFIEPLCVSALNTPPARASGQVFLRVMKDAIFSSSGGSNLLLPRIDLSALMPHAALAWLEKNGADIQRGVRVQRIEQLPGIKPGWVLQADLADGANRFDATVLACPPHEAARLIESTGIACEPWLDRARALHHEAITTVYAFGAGASLSSPMLALRASEGQPAQFVFDRAQLGGPPGLLAFVVSASSGDSASLGAQVLKQAAIQLGLANLEIAKTIVEKRATFACAPGLQRPARLPPV